MQHTLIQYAVAVFALCTLGILWSAGEALAASDNGPQKTVYLTFDDGPSRLTADVLDILKKEEVKATFFVLGQSALAHEEAILRIVSEGHALGNHTYDHDYEKLYPRFIGFWEQIQQTEEILERIAGIRTHLVRAPGGTYKKFDKHYFDYLEEAGYTVFDWHVDSGDSKRRGVPAREIVDNVKKAPLREEMIVLLHDGAGHAESVKALPDIIAYFKELGYRFAPLSDHVEPVRFRIAEELKDRPIALTDHEEIMKRIEAKRKKDEDRLQQAAGVIQKIRKPAVNLSGGTREQEIRIREFFERRGGQVEWWAHAGKAVVRHEGNIYEFVPDGQIMKAFHDGNLLGAAYVEGMRIKDGAIVVPARTAFRLPGSLNLWNVGNAR